jgi:HEAT repeat protein
MSITGRSLLRALEEQRRDPEGALADAIRAANDAPSAALRIEASRVLGALSGRAFGASWDVAERAAFALLEIAREADAPQERVALLQAMGRGLRNLWLLPYVHRRLSDDDETVVAAAVCAAGGLAFPALEEAIASGFLGADTPVALRRAAISALGRMGAESAASRLAPFIDGGDGLALAALMALTEIRSRAGEQPALDLLARDPPRDLSAAAIRYLAEMGREEVLPALRRLARDEEPEMRIAAALATRAFQAERERGPDERILAALTERDRAVRAVLGRRLRTLPVASVLEQAELLLRDDPEGVVQVVAEVRGPAVTHLLLRIAADEWLDVGVRARAAGSIEADEAWERDALVDLARGASHARVRVAAAQTLGAFAGPAYVLDHLAALADEPEPALRASLLWALQLASFPGPFALVERSRAEALVRRALGDPDAAVRRRAAYVAGNLDAAALVPDLVKLARDEPDRPDLRIAAFVALGEIGSPARFADLVHLWNREDDPQALAAASRVLERAKGGAASEREGPPAASGAVPPDAPASAPPSLARVHDRLHKLASSPNPTLRAAAARVAGLAAGSLPTSQLAALAGDVSPRVREQAVAALGLLARGSDAAARSETVPALARALADPDGAIQERAAEALLALGTSEHTARVLDYVSRTPDRAAALRVASRVTRPPDDGGGFVDALGVALARVGHDHPAYEPLLAVKIAALEASHASPQSRASVEAAIAAAFPAWPRLSALRGFAGLARSLRTAERIHASPACDGEADLSAAIVLWMKCLEGTLHAWLAPRLRALQRDPGTLWELTDHLAGSAWPTYQRYLAERWPDPVTVGDLSVEVPLRSSPHALREFQERRLKSLDSPLSVTEWSRLMLFLAVDHPSGPRDLLHAGGHDADRAVRLAHHLQVLAQVRNVVTHRSVAGPGTVTEFRRGYYAAFAELTAMAGG